MTGKHQHVHSKAGSRLGWISIATNILLFGLKYSAGVLSGSVALIADAWHTLTDSLSSIVVIVGIRVSKKPPDEKHPYGHGRAEWIASMVIGVFLLFIAFEFVRESIQRLIGHEPYQYGIMAWVATGVSIVMKELLARLSFSAGRKYRLKSLVADGWHHRTDALSSVIVLIGLAIGPYFWWVDGVLGILVSILIAYAAWNVMRESFSSLLGEKPDEKVVDRIYEIVRKNCQKEVNLHHIRIHEYGQQQYMNGHIKLPGQMSLEQSHGIATAIEDMILDELGIISEIHVEPVNPEKKV